MNFEDTLIKLLIETLNPDAYVPSERYRDTDTGKPDHNFAKKMFRNIGGANRVRGLSPAKVADKFSWPKSRSPQIATAQARRGWGAMNKKLQAMNRGRRVKTNPKMADMMQVDRNRRDLSKKRKPGIGRERPEDAAADARRDAWRRQAPGDK